jgi:hypothetical protein
MREKLKKWFKENSGSLHFPNLLEVGLFAKIAETNAHALSLTLHPMLQT